MIIPHIKGFSKKVPVTGRMSSYSFTSPTVLSNRNVTLTWRNVEKMFLTNVTIDTKVDEFNKWRVRHAFAFDGNKVNRPYTQIAYMWTGKSDWVFDLVAYHPDCMAGGRKGVNLTHRGCLL